MKILKDKKGFTLIELLAVIVVLAIITVLASTSVLSYLTTARKSALATEANEAISAASDLVSLINLNLKDGSDYGTSSEYCFTLEQLVEAEALDKSDLTGYEGKVVATKKGGESSSYTYTITMHNELYVVPGITSSVDTTDVEDYDSSDTTTSYSCSTASTNTGNTEGQD